MLTRFIRQTIRRIRLDRKWQATKAFMGNRSMVHALANSGVLTVPVKR